MGRVLGLEYELLRADLIEIVKIARVDEDGADHEEWIVGDVVLQRRTTRTVPGDVVNAVRGIEIFAPP